MYKESDIPAHLRSYFIYSDQIVVSYNDHPTPKPLALIQPLVEMFCPPDGILLDPFAGSSTIPVAAKIAGISFVAIEKEAKYVDLSNIRLGAIKKEAI